MKIFSLNKSILAKNVLNKFQSEEIDEQLKIEKFSDGEFCPIFKKSIRDEDIFIMADGHSSEDIVKLLLTIDACKRSGAKSTSLIMPYLPYSRSDKNDHIRQSISSKLLADVLSSVGISKLITIDLHNPSITGFYNVPVIHLKPNRIFIEYIKSLNLQNICFVSPDHGATKRTLDFAKNFEGSTFAVIDKKRTKPNEVASMNLLNSVEGKNVIIIDDMGDTMSTICKASNLVIEKGALSVRAVLTHPVLSGISMSNINESPLKELIVSDTITSVYKKVYKYNQEMCWNKSGKLSPKINIISCGDLLSNSIENILKKISINDINL